MKQLRFTSTLILLLLTALGSNAAVNVDVNVDVNIVSPEGHNQLRVWYADNSLHYSVSRHGQTLIEPSTLGLDMDNLTWERALARRYPQYDCWMQGFTADSVSTTTHHRDVVKPLWGEQAVVPDNYNAATLYLSKHDGSDYRLNIQVRCYDEGVALRYYIPEHPQAVFHKVTADLTTYTFPAGTKAWAALWAQAPYELKPIDQITSPVERALTIVLPDQRYCALADADTDDWCLQKNIAAPVSDGLQTFSSPWGGRVGPVPVPDGSPSGNPTLVTTMYSPVDVVTYYATPWKVILTAESYTQLLHHRYLIDNLNPPCAIADAAEWVKPGTIMRCTTLNTEAALRNIDFCAAHNIPYMLFDWKWYEPCTSHDGDATKVITQIDMPRVVAYGRQKGVGLWLYVNQHALMKQARELFPLLHQWGIVGVKSGFVQYASHRWSVWLHDLVRLAADNHLMMNIHDEYRPTGFSRTYPNLLTQEGIRGNEEWPTASHNTILPFTRMINGPADYTVCYYDHRLRNTHGHQLAASLVYYSPLLTLFWYDKPELSQGEPELEWFNQLKTTWDETRYLAGQPGELVVVARRSGDDWYVAAMNGDEGRTVTIDLAQLLTPGRRYTATIYNDDPSVATNTHVGVKTMSLKARATMKPLTLQLQPSGGATVLLKP